jgi:hypothetical protein
MSFLVWAKVGSRLHECLVDMQKNPKKTIQIELRIFIVQDVLNDSRVIFLGIFNSRLAENTLRSNLSANIHSK